MSHTIRFLILILTTATLVSCAHIPKENALRVVASQNGRYEVTGLHYDRAKKQARVDLLQKNPKATTKNLFRWYTFDRKTKTWRLLPMVAIRRPDAKK